MRVPSAAVQMCLPGREEGGVSDMEWRWYLFAFHSFKQQQLDQRLRGWTHTYAHTNAYTAKRDVLHSAPWSSSA